jgi:hypothetical protein
MAWNRIASSLVLFFLTGPGTDLGARCLQEIREQHRREEAAELKRGTVKWEVEVSLLQINLCSDSAAGRFLLAAQKCQLSGSMLPASQRKALCIEMQVSASTTFLAGEGDMHPASS